MLEGLKNLWGREPAVIIAVVSAAISVLVAFNVPLTQAQTAALMGLAMAIVGFITRTQVSPTK
jgi:diacylglycerol kinase